MQHKIIFRFASLLIAVSLLIGTNLAVRATSQSALSQSSAVTFNSVADAYVIQSSGTSNYGSSTLLRVDSSPVTRSYLRFTISGLNGAPIQSVLLRVYANSANASGFSVQALADNSWAENNITYANSPAAGNVIGNSSKFSAGTWVQVNVSSYIKGEGTYNLVLAGLNSTNTNLASREVSGKAPQLAVTLGGQATSTVTSAPTKTPVPTATLTKTLVPTSTSTKTAIPTATSTSSTPSGWEPSFPIRAAFYYPWFPEAWDQLGIHPYTNYTPTLGYYSSSDQSIVKQHIAMMQYGNIQAGIASWWGQGTPTDTRVAGLLSAAAGTPFRWALYYEPEGTTDPSASQIQSDLTYILNHYGNDPSYLRVNGKFVVFVYAGPNDACGMADRWKQANTVGAYVVLKVFAGFAKCASQPDSWHQYCPAVPSDQQGSMSYSISPGFWLKGNAMRLARDINRWSQNVRDMVASGTNWQLITTFSEWGEGTAVEPAAEWSSASGYGQYLDVLHTNGNY